MNETDLHAVLSALSSAFETRNLDQLLASFSASSTATYVGSEAGEAATGAAELRRLFTRLFEREEVYTFQFSHLVHDEAHGVAWVIADGKGVETRPDQLALLFPYRITGVLVLERAQWRWAVLAGSEPTPALDPVEES